MGSKMGKMKTGKILIGSLVMALVIFAACSKSDGTKIDSGKNLAGTFWLEEYERPRVWGGTSTVYSGLAFIDGTKAEAVTRDEDITSHVEVKNGEYKSDNDEWIYYADSKKHYEDQLKEMQATFKGMGVPVTDQQVIEELERIEAVAKFKIGKGKTKQGEEIDVLMFGIKKVGEKNTVTHVYRKSTLEELQEIFKGYRSK